MKRQKLEELLVKKFKFSQAKNKSDDHRFYVLNIPGLPPIHTKVSHTKKEMGAKLIGKIARQMRVHRPFFEQMMGCTKNSAEYIDQVSEDPYPPFDVRL